MHRDLLTSFIEKRLKYYKEPSREGTPRGEPIGLSLQKYKAALYLLKESGLKALAGEIGVSYGLLRKWKTEEKFKQKVDENRRDFIQYFIKSIETLKEDIKRRFERSLDEIALHPVPIALNDPKLLKYSGCSLSRPVLKKILKKLTVIFDTSQDPVEMFIGVVIYRVLVKEAQKNLSRLKHMGNEAIWMENLNEQIKRRENEIVNERLENLKQVILQQNPTEEERKKALISIGIINYLLRTPLKEKSKSE